MKIKLGRFEMVEILPTEYVLRDLDRGGFKHIPNCHLKTEGKSRDEGVLYATDSYMYSFEVTNPRQILDFRTVVKDSLEETTGVLRTGIPVHNPITGGGYSIDILDPEGKPVWRVFMTYTKDHANLDIVCLQEGFEPRAIGFHNGVMVWSKTDGSASTISVDQVPKPKED